MYTVACVIYPLVFRHLITQVEPMITINKTHHTSLPFAYIYIVYNIALTYTDDGLRNRGGEGWGGGGSREVEGGVGAGVEKLGGMVH